MAKNSRIKIYKEVRNFLLGFSLTSVIADSKGAPLVDYRDSNGKGLARQSRMSQIKTRGKRRTSNSYKKIH